MKKILLTVVIVSMILSLRANNLNISSTQIASVDTINSYANIQFNISWDNSWRDATNWDAVWIFVKYRDINGSGAWSHATFDTVGFTAPSGTTIDVSSDGKGFFLYRNTTGSGNISLSSASIRWKYGVDGISSTDSVNLKIFGIEMVYVPQATFSVGDGQTTPAQIYANLEAGTTGNTFQISNENSITLGGGSSGSLGNNNAINEWTTSGHSGDDFNDATSQSLPTAFPKGYDAFYCMKYELTQQQYVDMLNTCTTTQQTRLTNQNKYTPRGVDTTRRYGLRNNSGVWTTLLPHVPMIYMDWTRAACYADWSALRPMTELEFVKSCRGTATPVLNEFAWGNANIDLSNNFTLNNIDDDDEGIASGYDAGGSNGNCWVNSGSQNMTTVARVGIFAAHASNTGRVTSNATFYGVFDMSGNVWERVVSMGHAEGRKFTGNHGDGVLSTGGYADVSNWPGTFAGSLVNTNIGVGYQGGGLLYPTSNLERNARISSRRLVSGYYTTVIEDDGGRFIRSAN